VIEYPLLVIQAGVAEPFESTTIVSVSPALASLITERPRAACEGLDTDIITAGVDGRSRVGNPSDGERKRAGSALNAVAARKRVAVSDGGLDGISARIGVQGRRVG